MAAGERVSAGLDAIARDLASGQISRRTALKRFAGASLGAMLPGALFADGALARCPKSRRCKGKCCPSHAHCVHGKCKCRKPFSKCGKSCRNLHTDPKNCGSCGHKCPAGKTCQNGHCKAGATCVDGLKNGSETDIDCGGPDCDPCSNGLSCGGDGDCESSHCASGTCVECISSDECPGNGVCDENNVCVPASCVDTVKNGNETDVDCGGPDCVGCADGKLCDQNSDCLSGFCNGGTCQAPVCGNDVREPGEVCDGPDLNGESCASQGFTSGTLACAPNCLGFDTSGCSGPSHCVDTVKNGDETDVDCGGSCPGCANGKVCNLGTDCQSGHCSGNVCVQCALPADCPGSDTICQTRTCTAGTCGVNNTPASTTCSSASCVSVTTLQTAGHCDGSGTCAPGNQVNCSPYTCSGFACRTFCTVPSDCVAPATCNAGVCS